MLFDDTELALEGATLHYWPNWLEPGLAQRWFSDLQAQTPWQQSKLKIYGRYHLTPRLTAWYGDAEARYRYSGLINEPLPWTPLLREICQRVEAHVQARFNAVLLNYYRDGADSMGWHSDDEAELGPEPIIASLNLGAPRRFDFRRVGATRIEHSLELAGGSLLLMAGKTQHHWQHQVAKTRQVLAPRINLTFRLIRFSV